MSMLEYFFSIEGDKSIFDGLEILKDPKLCDEYMGKYPVISVSLKGINAAAYEGAFDFAVQIMQRAAEAFQFLCDSECLSEHDKEAYKKLLDSNMSEAVFCSGSFEKCLTHYILHIGSSFRCISGSFFLIGKRVPLCSDIHHEE